MIDGLAAFVVARRRLVLALSVLLLLAFAVLGAGAFGALKDGGFDDPASDSARASTVLDQQFGGQPDLVLLVRARAGGSIDAAPAAAAGAALTRAVAATPGVDSVTSYFTGHAAALRSRDGTEALLTMHVQGDDAAAGSTVGSLIARLTPGSGAIVVRAGGGLGTGHDLTGQVGRDLLLTESIAVPLTALLLFVAFGSLVAALLPLAIGLLAIAGTFAELDLLGHLTDTSTYAINLTTALGLGLGIDYALLIVNRFREQIAQGADTPTAVRVTLRTAGRTVLFSAATVAVALAALVVFPLYFLRSFAYAGFGVVVIAMLAALVVLPALLAVLGPRVDAGRLRRRRALRSASEPSRVWGGIAAAAMRRPLLVAVPIVAVLLVLGAPFLHVRFSTPDDRVLPASAPSRQVGDALRHDFAANDTAPVYVLVRDPTSTLLAYAEQLSRLPDVTGVSGPAASWVDGRQTAYTDPHAMSSQWAYLTVAGPADTGSDAATALVRAIRATPAPAGSSVLVGGQAATLVDSTHAIGARLPYALGWIVVTTLILLFLFTGSVLLPVKALVLNALTLSAVFGVVTWIFQEGHLSGLLGFTPGPVDTSMPVLLFCIAFGLSMDYEVFLLSRIKELREQGSGHRESVVGGLARTGRIISTAAGLLAVTFFAFSVARVSFLQLFGIGTGLAVVIDATVVRGALVPAVMQVAGRWNWWAPGALRRLHGRVGLAEAPPPAPPRTRTITPDPVRVPQLVWPQVPYAHGRPRRRAMRATSRQHAARVLNPGPAGAADVGRSTGPVR